MVVTTDFCLEGRHFRRDWHTPESAGHRCLARGLSDLASMGAKPLASFLSLALPAGLENAWLRRFFKGFRALADEFKVPLAGGDTTGSPSAHVIADIVLTGSAPAGRALCRSTASPGDILYVTGRLGGSAAELIELRSRPGRATGPGAGANHPQMFPMPRLRVGSALVSQNLATACIDISDGLSTDLKHLCIASNLSAQLELDRVPLHPLAAGKLDLALHGGEDYELLFSAAPRTRVPRSIGGVPLTRIGVLSSRSKAPLITGVDSEGCRTAIEAGGWEHVFR